MRTRKYIWYINKKKLKRKRRKYKAQEGKGFGNRFKVLYSIGKQWQNSLP